MGNAPTTTLRGWDENDLGVLEGTMGNPAATVYLGGPESAQSWRYDLGGSR